MADHEFEALFLLAKVNEWHYENLMTCCAENNCIELVQLLQKQETRELFDSLSRKYVRFKEIYLTTDPIHIGKNTLIRHDHCELLMQKFNKSSWVQFKQLFRTELAQKIAEVRYEEIFLVPEAFHNYKKNRKSLFVWIFISIYIPFLYVISCWFIKLMTGV